MRLSEAIRKGIPLVPRTKGCAFRFDATGTEWAERRAHRRDLLGADAFGTALIGIANDAAKAVERVYEGPEGSPLLILNRLYPFLYTERTQCPECAQRKGAWSSSPPELLVGVLWHLQDRHDWSREQVADYLEGRNQ